MTKLRLPISILTFLLSIQLLAQNNYTLFIRCVDKDSAFLNDNLKIPSAFSSRAACMEYVNQLPRSLQSRGYVTASLDSAWYDSAFAKIVLFTGDIYKWAQIDASLVDISLLQNTGWKERMFSGKPMDFAEVKLWQDRILNYLENNGHPFAKVYLDSLQLENESVSARLKVEKGPLATVVRTAARLRRGEALYAEA
jgi:hypothetical protein